MPKLASSKKRLRQAQKAQIRNKAARSSLRSALKKALSTSSKDEAEALVNATQSVIDKTVKKGVIHLNAGARYKSRLRRHVASLEA